MEELTTESSTVETKKMEDPNPVPSQEQTGSESPLSCSVEASDGIKSHNEKVEDDTTKEKTSAIEESSLTEANLQTEETSVVENFQSGESIKVNETPLLKDKLEIGTEQCSKDELDDGMDISECKDFSAESKVEESKDTSPTADIAVTEDNAAIEDKSLVEMMALPVEDKTAVDDNVAAVDSAKIREEVEIEGKAHQDEVKDELKKLSQVSEELVSEEIDEVKETETVQNEKEMIEVKGQSLLSDERNLEENEKVEDLVTVGSEEKPDVGQIQVGGNLRVEENDQNKEKVQSHDEDEVEQQLQVREESKLHENGQVEEMVQVEEGAKVEYKENLELGSNLLVENGINVIDSKEKEVVLDSSIPDTSHVGGHSQSSDSLETKNFENKEKFENKTKEDSEIKEEISSEEDEFLEVGDGEDVEIQDEQEFTEEEEEIDEGEEEEEEEGEEEEDDEEEDESEGDLVSEHDVANERGEGEVSGDEDKSHAKDDDNLPRDGDGASYVNEKRIMGDGEEEPEIKAEKRLDDDEDKANPAYIPRKGAFYEHDLRLDPDEDAGPQENDEKTSSRPNKKLWVDENKWQHDRYDARLQAPKSSQELSDAYGYDIRRGKESDIPVRNTRSRGRRPGQKNRFGDYLPRRMEAEHFAEEEMFYSSSHPGRRRNQMNNDARSQRGRPDHHRKTLNEQSEFPPLRDNVHTFRDVNVVPQTARNNVVPAEVVRSEQPVETNSNRRGQESVGANPNPPNKMERRLPRDARNEEDYDTHQFPRRRGGQSRGRGRGRGRWQRDFHEPGGIYVNNDEFYERNTEGERSSQSYGRSNRRSENEGHHVRQENRRGLELNTAGGSIAEDSFRRRHVDDTRDRIQTRDGNRPQEVDHERNHYRREEFSEGEPMKSQDSRFRVQRSSDYSDRHTRQNPEAFATRTIQNSNLSGRLVSNSRAREMEKQELLKSVSTAMKNMALDERGSANNTHGNVDVRTDRLTSRADEHQGNSTFKTQAPERMHRDEHLEKAAQEDKKGGSAESTRKKMSVVIQTTDAPEMIPPVTVVSTFSKPLERTVIAPRLAASERTQNKGWAGGEFTPAWRLQATLASNIENASASSSGKPKRYSSQRQKAAGAEASYLETSNADYHETVEVAGQSVMQPLTTSLPARPLPASTFYDSSSSYAATSFHPAQGMSLGMHGMQYQMPTNVPHNMYSAQPQIAKSGNPMHNVFLPPPGSMLPNPYLSMPSLMNYPSQFQMTPVQLQPGGPNAHLHGSLPDQEQVDMARMVYFNQQGIAVPLMHHPQFIDQNSYMDETNAVDPSMASQGYIETRDMTSPTGAQQEY